jgi:hypothetical protein
VYATPGSNVVSEFGGSGTTIPENRFDDFAAWATTNSQQNALQSAGADWFNAPARGFAVCTPGGSGNSTCELRDANNVVVGTLISAAASSPATSKSGSNQAHVQLVNGLQTPIGSVPQGMRIASGSSVWSADGRYKLAVVDGVASLWDGAGSASYPDASGDGMASVWTAGTSHPGGYLELASSGVLNLRDTSGTSYWASGTPSPAVSGAPFLVVGGDYGLSVTDNSHLSSPLWHR